MTGGVHVPQRPSVRLKSSRGAPPPGWPPRFVKLRLTFDDGGELAIADGRRLGRIRLRHDPRREPPLTGLGFDALRELPPPARFHELLTARASPIKAVLLDQSFAAGVGNWIADEVLYQARIAPNRPARSLRRQESARLRSPPPRSPLDGRARPRRQRPLPQDLALPPPLGPRPARPNFHRRASPLGDDRRPHHRLGPITAEIGGHRRDSLRRFLNGGASPAWVALGLVPRVRPRARHHGEPSSPLRAQGSASEPPTLQSATPQPPLGDGGPSEPDPERSTATGEPCGRARGLTRRASPQRPAPRRGRASVQEEANARPGCARRRRGRDAVQRATSRRPR